MNADQFLIAARRNGKTVSAIAGALCVSRAYLYAALAGKINSPRAARVAADARQMAGVSAPEPIGYDKALCLSSTGLDLPIELHNFCRAEVAAGRAASISKMFVAAVEAAHGVAIREYLATAPANKRLHLARRATVHAVRPSSPYHVGA